VDPRLVTLLTGYLATLYLQYSDPGSLLSLPVLELMYTLYIFMTLGAD